MLTKASAITSEVRTRAEVKERAGSARELVRTLTIVGLVCVGLPGPAQAQAFISGWGQQVFDSRWNSEAFVEIAAGDSHTVARRSDGSVVEWGGVGGTVPALPSGLTYVEIAAGVNHTVARYGIAASVVSVGTGCGGAGMPVFGCDAPAHRAECHLLPDAGNLQLLLGGQ